MVICGELFIDKPKFKTIPEVDKAIDSISCHPPEKAAVRV
jgi:hypothetical protein